MVSNEGELRSKILVPCNIDTRLGAHLVGFFCFAET